MKDEHHARIEALKLTQMLGGIESIEARIRFAHKLEQYILEGYSGEAPKPTPAPQARDEAEEVPVTTAKGRKGGPRKKASEVPASSGEASDQDEEGEMDSAALEGRPSTRVSGMNVQ